MTRVGARQQVSLCLKFRTFYRTHSVPVLFSAWSGKRKHLGDTLLLRRNGLVDADVEVDTIKLGEYRDVNVEVQSGAPSVVWPASGRVDSNGNSNRVAWSLDIFFLLAHAVYEAVDRVLLFGLLLQFPEHSFGMAGAVGISAAVSG